MSASVVVPTRDRPAALRRCLAALSAQRDVTLEIIVVDDGSSARSAVAAVVAEFDGNLVRLDGAGPAAARNAGIAVAGADRILLVDDDCIPLPGWARALCDAGGHAPLRVTAGRVRLPRTASAWMRASEQIALHAEAASGFVRTLNLSCSRELLLGVPFDDVFTTAAGEDRDWCVRARRAGADFAREPAAIVEHRAELGARTFFRQQLRYGRAVTLLRRRGTHVPVPPRAVTRGYAAGFRDGIPVGLAMVAAAAATAVGCALESRSDPSG